VCTFKEKKKREIIQNLYMDLTFTMRNTSARARMGDGGREDNI